MVGTNIPPDYGELIDIGGRSLVARVRGSADRTVVFENGGGSPSSVWVAVERLLSDEFRTVAYDRAGLGLSPRTSGPRTGDAVVEDLRCLLAALKVDRCVLVSHSAGALFARLFQARDPDAVSGVVFVDGVDGFTYDEVERHLKSYERLAQRVIGPVTRFADALGVAAVVARRGTPPPAIAQSPAMLAARDLMWRGRNCLAGSRAEGRELRTVARQVAGLPDLGALPLAVVRAGDRRGSFRRIEEPWDATQRRLAMLSTDVHFVTADGAGHFVQTERPEVVAEAIRTVASGSRRSA